MSSSSSVSLDFLGVQNAPEANGKVVKGSSNLEMEFGPEKHLSKLRFVQDLSRIKPQMMQKAFSSIGLSEDKKANFSHGNRQVKGFNGRSEASSDIETLELFPMSTGSDFSSKPRDTENKTTLPFVLGQTNPDSSKFVTAKVPEQQSTAQLTFFYNGAMNVYNVPVEKAQAIMRLASANTSSKSRISTSSSSKIEPISKPLPSSLALNAENENQAKKSPVGLELVRKMSVQRFLQKRKERLNSLAPYSRMKPATLSSKAGKESDDDQIVLSLC